MYIDLLVFGVFVLSVVVLAFDAFYAGFHAAAGNQAAHTGALWGMARDAVVATGALAWVFFRYFKLRSQEQKEPWFT